jgi:hypothetical protein
MTINPFKRVLNYFSTTNTIQANAIDSQFNLLSDYVNKNVKPILDQLSSDTVPGSRNLADAGKYYQNIGDGTTKWASITSLVIADNSLTLQKLDKNNAGSILAAGTSGAFNAVTATANNQTLTARTTDVPIWKKLTGDNIADRGVTGISIANQTITNDNLPAYLLQTQIAINSLVATKFKQNVITTAKLGKVADGDGLTANKLTPELAADFTDKIWENIMPNNFLQTMQANDWYRVFMIGGGSYDAYWRMCESMFFGSIPIPVSKFTAPKLSNLGEGLDSGHVQAGSIEGKRLQRKVGSSWFPLSTEFIADGSIGPEHLTPETRAKLGF